MRQQQPLKERAPVAGTEQKKKWTSHFCVLPTQSIDHGRTQISPHTRPEAGQPKQAYKLAPQKQCL